MSAAILNLTTDVVELARAVCDIESVSGNEKELADAIETALRQYGHLEVIRDADAIIARTNLGRTSRVVIAGHIDTVPVADNLPVQFLPMEREQVLWGRGTVDMKAGVAVQRIVNGQRRPKRQRRRLNAMLARQVRQGFQAGHGVGADAFEAGGQQGQVGVHALGAQLERLVER